MAVRKSAEETVVVAGDRETWMVKCRQALERSGFSKIEAMPALFQLQGGYKKATVYGEILLTLLPEGSSTRINIKATANMDNLFALLKSPTKEIIKKFKEGLQ